LTSSFEGNPLTQGHEILSLKTSVLGAAHSKDFWGVYTIQQTSSKFPANVFKIHVLMLDVCCKFAFAGSCKHLIRDPSLHQFDTVHECDRQTDRQTDA